MEAQPIRLLMVEDDKVDRMAFERLVKAEKLPYQYKCVGSVKEGRRLLETEQFDIVITDYMLGDGTAFDLFDAVATDVPIVLVTGAGGEEVAVQAMKAGASDYLMKDVGGSYLKTLPITVENTLKSKRQEQELRKYHEELEKLVEQRTRQLQEKNVELEREIEERKRAEEALRLAHDKLEVRVEQRTSELRMSNLQLLNQIAERRKAEEELRKSKETVEAMLNATNDCAFLLDRDGAFVALNPSTAETLASEIDQLMGNSYFSSIREELAATRKRWFDQVVQTGRAVKFEDQDKGVIFDHSYHPVFDSDGTGVVRVAAFTRDITEQKKAHELLVQRQRLAALGEMAGGVAHNFNNLLQIVIGAAGLAEGDLDAEDYDEVRTTLRQITESAQLGSETVKQLQDFARVRTEDPTVAGKVFDLSETVGRAIQVSRPWWKSAPEKRGIQLALRTRLTPGCFVKGKQNELFEVIVNLVKNATEAVPDGGKIYVKTYIEDGKACLQVRDNGMGIAKENLNKVFEPFWTTKGVQGTGMGLSTSVGIVTRHGGTISVKSWEGSGTVFTVALPVQAKPAAQGQIEAPPLTAFKARVLIIDDQETVVDLLEKGLKKTGQTVLKAFSGKDGIDLFDQDSIDIVICDLGMPDMNGWLVAKAVMDLSVKKGVKKPPFVLCTGWGGQIEEQEKIAEFGVDRVVEKPIRYPVLFEIMRELLQKGRSGNS